MKGSEFSFEVKKIALIKFELKLILSKESYS